MKAIKSILGFTWEKLRESNNTSKFIIAMLGLLLSSLLYAPIPKLLGKATELMMSFTDLKTFLLLLFGSVALYIVRYFFIKGSKNEFTKIEKKLTSHIKLEMVKKFFNLSYADMASETKGSMMGRLSEPNQLATLFSPSVINVVVGIFEFIISFSIVFSISFKLGTLLLIFFFVYYFLLKASSRNMQKLTMNSILSSNTLSSSIFEGLNGYEEIKKLNVNDFAVNGIAAKLDNYNQSAYKEGKKIVSFSENISLAGNLANVLVLMFYGILIFLSDLSFSEYLVVSLYVTKALGFIQGMASLGTITAPASVVISRIEAFLGLPEEDEAFVHILTECNTLDLNNISFSYEKEKILENISIHLKEGDMLLLKGKNGSGKSTLAKLILGLYKTSSGSIEINGIDINKYSKKSIRNCIGIVSQQAFLFQGTVLDNIICGDDNITLEMVEDFIKVFGLHSYIEKFENGLSTQIPEDGKGLSGGQAVLISLLRILLRNRDVIILDETTAHIDTATTNLITQLFSSKSMCKILIVITHDNSWEFIKNEIEL